MDKWMWIFGIVFVFGIGVTLSASYLFSGSSSDSIDFNIVSRTEYVPLDVGQMISEIRFSLTLLPVPATCYASVLYPNKTSFITNQLMSASNITGTQFINFTVPITEGVYEYQSRCEYNSKNFTTSKAFHVSSSFRRIQEDIRSQVTYLQQGVSEVQWGKNSRNGWKLVSDYVNNISALTCRIQPLDQDAEILYEDSFDQNPSIDLLDPGVGNVGNATGNLYRDYEIYWNCVSCFEGPNIVVGIDKLTFGKARVAVGSGKFSTQSMERNLSFIPSRVFATMTITQVSGTPNVMQLMSFTYYDMNNVELGALYLEHPYLSFRFNNCGSGNPIDECGLYNRCWGPISGNYACSTIDAGTTNPAVFDVDMIVLANTAGIDLQQVDRVVMRFSDQSRIDSLTDTFDDIIVVAEPIGIEFIEQDTQNFGVNWTASKSSTSSWRDYKIKCAVVYELETGIKTADGLEQFVFISNQDRLRAVVVK